MEHFFDWSGFLDFEVTKQLSHIKPNWELMWDESTAKYIEEEDSFAEDLNKLIEELKYIKPPNNYHKYEDIVCKYQNEFSNWNIQKKGNKWEVGDYACFLEQGGFHDINVENLIIAAAGRINAAIKRGQTNYDDMEESHRIMLGDLIAVILFHREGDKIL